MDRILKCFISASYETDVSIIRSILEENNIETFDLYDFAIGDSLQQILKRKLRQADFAVFVVSKGSKSILYEIGVCEGLGKQSLILIDKEADLPFYLENKLSLTANLKDRDFLTMTVLGFIDEMKLKKKGSHKSISTNQHEVEQYNEDTRSVLMSLLEQTRRMREYGKGIELEYIVEEIFRTIRIKYINNTNSPDIGIDFALWSDNLGRITGNPIIVEVKYGKLTNTSFQKAESQIQKYASKSDAKVALLLYLDKSKRRFNLNPSLKPLIIAYDIEDFISDILESNFENVILTSRNKIAHNS